MSDGIFGALGGLFAPNVAGPEIAGLNQGYSLAMPQLQAGLANVGANYGQAIPYLQQMYGQAAQPLQSVYQTGQQGQNALNTLLGITPPGGAGSPTSSNAISAYLQGLPGNQYATQQATNALNAQAQAMGYGSSGNAQLALSTGQQALAGQQYQSAVNNLAPYSQMFTGGANALGNLYAGQGNAVAGLYQGETAQQSPFYNSMANLGWGLGTGTGAANAQQNVLNTNFGLGATLGGAGLFSGLMGGSSGSGGSGGSNSLFGIGSNLGALLSDARLKEDIAPVGKLYDNTNVYAFRYKGDPTPRIGLMAQEIERKTPSAVSEIMGGIKVVDYGKATRSSRAIAALLEAA